MNIKDKTKLVMERCGVIITYRCNLKCRLCTAYSPYYKIPPHFSYNNLKISIDKYFNIVDFVKKFTVSGGEPLLHPELIEILNHILMYESKFEFIEIITNGTIVPNIELIELINQNRKKFKILVDNYGKDVSKKVNEIDELLSKNKINYIIRNNNKTNPHSGGWIDFGDFSEKLYSEEDSIEHFKKCAIPQKMKFCFTIKNGEIHPCGPSYRCMELGVISKNKKEFIDLLDDTESYDQKKKKIISLQNIEKLSACSYCKGMCEDSERFIPAEQIKE